MKDCTVNILGTEYKIYHRDEKEDELLDGKYRDGYTDISNHEIARAVMEDINLEV